jgi:hypothetical protein
MVRTGSSPLPAIVSPFVINGTPNIIHLRDSQFQGFHGPQCSESSKTINVTDSQKGHSTFCSLGLIQCPNLSHMCRCKCLLCRDLTVQVQSSCTVLLCKFAQSCWGSSRAARRRNNVATIFKYRFTISEAIRWGVHARHRSDCAPVRRLIVNANAIRCEEVPQDQAFDCLVYAGGCLQHAQALLSLLDGSSAGSGANTERTISTTRGIYMGR